MRRTTILSLTAAAALAAAPAMALAHDGGGDDDHGYGHGDGHGDGHDATPVATVASFSGGTLTLTLTDGSTLAAKVTDRTDLTCEAAAPTTPPTASKANFTSRRHGDHGFGRHRYRPCSTDSLTAGAKVTDAEVSVTTSGAVFREVDLVQ